jgi:hypothetical protein
MRGCIDDVNYAETIITCSPKRWETSPTEPSDLHKSIRARLRTTHDDDEICSVFGLAIIIIEQCTRVFFNIPLEQVDLQPNAIEAFVTAIGRLVSGLSKFKTTKWY